MPRSQRPAIPRFTHRVSWNQVELILNTKSYVQLCKEFPDDQFNILSHYLSFATKCFGPITTGNSYQHLHLIAPIIICVCFLFNGEEDLGGDFVNAHGHFEFVLRRGDKQVCIVEAKMDDMEQRTVQALLGCEVAAEIGHLDILYGIITNYIQWNFLRSLDDKIELEGCILNPSKEELAKTCLLQITGKIYAMLSDE